MSKILITGATGNIGAETIRFLQDLQSKNQIVAAARNIEKAKKQFAEFPQLQYVSFDFENSETFSEALKNVDCIFLLRPPHIADVEKQIKPFLQKAKENEIKKIVFLSVQGVEKSKVIPHNKIEKLIKELAFDYIFLRPSYFMQNLTTTLRGDIKSKHEIILPAGRAKFNWVDISNIAEVAAILINRFSEFKNQAFEITGIENLDFYAVAELITKVAKTPIRFKNTNPFSFYRIKKNEGMVSGMITVMIMLHFLPRFQKEPKVSGFYKDLTGKTPTTVIEFLEREIELFE